MKPPRFIDSTDILCIQTVVNRQMNDETVNNNQQLLTELHRNTKRCYLDVVQLISLVPLVFDFLFLCIEHG